MLVKDGKLLKYEGTEKEPIIPVAVTEIGAEAFLNCTFLETILIPENVRVIGERTFAGCTNLKEVYMTSAVEIGAQAFKDCVSLEVLFEPYNSNFQKNTFENCAGLKRFYHWARPNLKITGSEVYEECSIKFDDLLYRMSDFLPGCLFIRCNDLVEERNRKHLAEVFAYIEKREEKYRQYYGDRNRCVTAYDKYDHSLSEGKKVTVLGCGGGGAEIIHGISSKINSDAVYLVGISTEAAMPVFQDFPQHIALYEHNQNCCCKGLSPGGFTELMMPDAVTYLHKYLPVIKNSRKIFVTGGIAGPSIYVMSRLIACAASYYGVPVKMFLTEPFWMEGVNRQRLARETLQDLKYMIDEENVITDGLKLENDDLKHIPDNWGLRKAEIIRKILAALSDEGIK